MFYGMCVMIKRLIGGNVFLLSISHYGKSFLKFENPGNESMAFCFD